MSYHYTIHSEVNCVYAIHSTPYALDEEQHQLIDMEMDPLFSKSMNILRDISATSLPVEYSYGYFKNQSQPQFEGIVEGLGQCKIAWVLGNGRDFGLVLQWLSSRRLTSTIVERKPFRDIESAREWLEIPKGFIF
jgi:hypothetical protein